MFKKLQDKWKVTGWQFVLIFSTFALGGSLTGYVGKKIMGWIAIDTALLYAPLYIIIVTLLWPCMVLLVSIPMGQFRFFTGYLGRMGKKLGIGKKQESHNPPSTMNSEPSITNNEQSLSGKSKAVVKVAIFASGAGSNAKKIIEHFKGHSFIEPALVVCNKPGAGVLQIAADNGVSTLLIEKEQFFRGDGYIAELKAAGIEFIILAGFLWKIPATLVAAYPGKIVNIHPALLPKYGGKGMYGHFVHEAVIANHETESGITIHYVDELYDHGGHIFQATCPVLPGDTPTTLAQRIHELEHKHYATIIEQMLSSAIAK